MQNPAAFVGRTGQAQLELVRAIARVDEMRMAIDESWKNPRAARIVLCARFVFPSGPGPAPSPKRGIRSGRTT